MPQSPSLEPATCFILQTNASASRVEATGPRMIEPRIVNEIFAVSPQIEAADIVDLAARGFARVVNNRPDGEAPDQPSSATMEAAARAAGLDYLWEPVTGGPTPSQADAMLEATRDGKKTLAFCRSGTRSITAWAIGQARAGAMTVDELVSLGEKAGYDLAWLRGAFR